MKLYLGNTVTAVTTALLLVLLGFIGRSICIRSAIHFWGRRSVLLLVIGLIACCFAAARDGLDRTIQYAIDGSAVPGIFPLVSAPHLVGCIGAAVILIAAVGTAVSRSQQMRELWFYFISGGITVKLLTVELARLLCR